MVLTWSAARIVKSISPQVASYNMTMSQLLRCSHWRQVLEMLRAMPQQSLQPDGVSYNVGISACGLGLQWQAALQLLSRADGRGCHDLVTFSAAMTCCRRARQLDSAMVLLKQTQQLRLGVDLVLLGSVLSTCERLHRWRTALEVFHLGLQVTADVQQILPSCHHLLATCSKASRWSVGLQLLQQLELRQLAPDGVTFAVMVEAMSCSARWRDALLVVEGMWRRKVVPSGHLQVVQQEILCRAQAWRSLKRGLTSLVRHDVAAAAAAAAAGDPDEGKVHRLAEVSWRLRMMGCMPGALELHFFRMVFGPAVLEVRELMTGSSTAVGLGPTGVPNVLSQATTGLGGLERDALELVMLRAPR